MPTRPPVFRPPGWQERTAWQRPAGSKDRRKRGWKAWAERKALLAAEPLCRLCKAEGRRTKATEVDHIVPLAWGGSDERGNKQALCEPCHAAKSAAERLEGRRRSGRPPGG